MARKSRFTAKERKLRQQYSIISRRIRQQLKRLAVKYPDNTLQDYYRGEFPTLIELGNISIKGLQLINKRATQVYRSQQLTTRNYNSSLLTATQSLRGLNGFEFVNEGNIADVWRFVDEMRARGLADIYGYKYFIGMYNRISNTKNVDMEATINEWVDYSEKYSARKAEALRSGKEVPLPKKLKVRKAKKGSGNS